jgi:succinoglycan biosynthesis protein ExoA
MTESRTYDDGPLRDGRWPFVSVILPVYNESAFIERSLGSILEQDYPADRMEVLVVDGQSTDDTREKVATMSGGPITVRLLDNPRRIIPSAMNVGLREARGPVILRVDGHSTIAPDYLRTGVLALKKTGAHTVGCGVYNQAVNYVSRGISAATGAPFGVGGSLYHYTTEEVETDAVFMQIYPKWAYEHIGLYNEEMACNEDDELSFRLRKAGGKIVFVPALDSRYYPRTGIRKLARQFFRYGYWKVRVMQHHPSQMRISHLIPSLFTAGLIGGVALGPFMPVIGCLWAAMCALWIAGALHSTVKGCANDGWDLFPILPLVFLTLHLSYGTGFLIGLIRFAGRWKIGGTPVDPLPDMDVWESIELASDTETNE